MAAYGLGIVVAPVLGPTLGGWLTDTFSWRYAFYINIPVGILAVILISRFVHDPPFIKNAKVGPFDNIGFGLLVVWTGCLQIVLDKGQEDDWFGAVWVRWAVAALIVALDRMGLALLDQSGRAWWTCTSSRTATSAPAASSLRCWACAFTSPSPFCRSITRRFSATPHSLPAWWWVRAASDRLSARRSSACLGSRFDNRKLLSAGFIGFGVCSLYFGMVNLDIGPYTLLLPITLTGFALSFVFVPLATLSTATIKREEMGNATGLFNMLRNIGGSIGIAMATTAIIRRSAYYQTEMGAHISASDPAFQQKSQMAARYLGQHLGHAAGRPGAMGLLYGMMQQQAALRSYVDVFRWTALLAFFCAGAVWLFRKPPANHEAPPGAH